MSEDALTERDFREILVEALGLSRMMLGWVGVKIGVKEIEVNWLTSSSRGRRTV
jgi:hypothetical protein